MINSVNLVGRLTKDPELKYTPTGVAVVTFTVAVNRTFTNGQGEKEADFISCVAWRKQAENLANFQRKGALIGIEGRIQTRNYDDPQGKKVYVTEVVAETIHFLEPASKNGNNGQGQQGGGYTQNQGQGQQGGYNQNQGGYNPNQGQSQQGGYNPNQGQGQQGGYNPNQGQSQQGGYNQNQGQGQQGGYNPNQGQSQQGGYNPNQGQGQGGYNPNQGQSYNQNQGQGNPFENDPFANNGGGPIAVSEDDLPF